MLAIREDHTHSDQHAVNTLVRVALDGTNEGQILAGGNDFYASPAISPDGQWLAWLTWNHPNMPWDGTELWVAPVQSDGTLGTPVFVAGVKKNQFFSPRGRPKVFCILFQTGRVDGGICIAGIKVSSNPCILKLGNLVNRSGSLACLPMGLMGQVTSGV